jgi:polysaccharide biosynthesis/export protein
MRFCLMAFVLAGALLPGCASESYQAPAAVAAPPGYQASAAVADPQGYQAPAAVADPPGVYRLGTGDQLRLIVFDQPGVSNVYGVDPAGNVSVPLIGPVRAEGKTTRQLEGAVAGRLREENLVADPKVSVEVAAYRPFSILGEVRTPGRLPYFPGMTIEAAVAAAGGYTLHADKKQVRVTRRDGDRIVTAYYSPAATFQPGDTLYVDERWF